MNSVQSGISYFGCCHRSIERAYQMVEGRKQAIDLKLGNSLASRLALVYEAVTLGSVASTEVTLPLNGKAGRTATGYYYGTLMGAHFEHRGKRLLVYGLNFNVIFSETSVNPCQEDRLRIAFDGNPSMIDCWLSLVEIACFPSGQLPIIFWPNGVPSGWISSTITEPNAMTRMERGALEVCMNPWGYRTHDLGEETVRTYYFQNSTDGTYARLTT